MDDYEFDGVESQNETGFFDAQINAALRCYVYAFRSPDGHIFYVGKGGGSGDGNERVLAHFAGAAETLRKRLPPRSAKERTILETWKQEMPVTWFIVRRGMDEPTANEVEAALIDTLPMSTNGKVDNIVRGLGTYRGLLEASEVAALAAPPVSPGMALSRVFVFQIQKAVQDSTRSLYEATRGDWVVTEPQRGTTDQPVAVGVVDGISRFVSTVESWAPRPPGGRTFAFSGQPLEGHALAYRSFVNVLAPAKGFLMRGGGYAIVEFDGHGRFRCLRGSSDKEWRAC
jgi:hypothetical protein